MDVRQWIIIDSRAILTPCTRTVSRPLFCLSSFSNRFTYSFVPLEVYYILFWHVLVSICHRVPCDSRTVCFCSQTTDGIALGTGWMEDNVKHLREFILIESYFYFLYFFVWFLSFPRISFPNQNKSKWCDRLFLYWPLSCNNLANLFVISNDVSINRSTQLVKHVSVLLSNLPLGESMHLSQQISLNSWICEKK